MIMGWAERANTNILPPKVKLEKEHFKRKEYKRMWALLIERVNARIVKHREKNNKEEIRPRFTFKYRTGKKPIISRQS